MANFVLLHICKKERFSFSFDFLHVSRDLVKLFFWFEFVTDAAVSLVCVIMYLVLVASGVDIVE